MNVATETTAEVTVMQEGGGALATALSVPAILRHYELVQNVLKQIMKEGTHFGASFPGDKKVNLLKPGADALCLAFQLAPEYQVEQINLPNGHREVSVVCKLRTPAGRVIGQGVGSCSTMESKYRYRNAQRKCPTCGIAAIIMTKKGRNPGGYWCVPDKGGCGANFNAGAPEVEQQECGKVENPDPADQFNTVLKISKKRAHVDATITATAASDLFHQDLEDIEARAESAERKEEAKRPAPAVSPAAAQPGTDRHSKAAPAAAATTAAKPASSTAGQGVTSAAPAAGIKGHRPHGPDVMGEATKVADITKWYEVAIDIYGEKFAKVVWKAAQDYKERFDLLRGLCLDAEAIEKRVGMAGAEDMIGAELRDVTWDTDGVHVIAGNLRSMSSRIDQQQLVAAAVAPVADDEPPF